MWNVRGASLVNGKFKLLFLISWLIFGIVFCPQAHGSPANVAYFAGGCFWCTEAIFEEAPGVTSVTSGYMHGAETIQVTFDPVKTSYDKLLILFWEAHDPTQIDRQGPDVGKQYRSAIFYVNDHQRDAAQKLKPQVQKFYSKPIVTEITQAGSFRAAPENHQNFCRKNPNNPYVQQIIEPKLKKLGLADDAQVARIRRQIASTPMTQKVTLSNDQWRKILAPGQFQVLREAKTEAPYKNAYWNNHEKGLYLCAACGDHLFGSDAKFESRTGWPSFYTPLARDKVTTAMDTSHGMAREEVRCARCGSHLGHLFNDGPSPTYLRYCLNSAALKFVKSTNGQ